MVLEDLDALMDANEIDALLVVGNVFEVPDIYWLTGFRSPDTIAYFHSKDDKPVGIAAFNTIKRIKKQSFLKRTYDLSELYLRFRKAGKRAANHPNVVYGTILQEHFTGKTLGVPNHLPARILVAIQNLGYTVKVVPDLLKDARATKSKAEIKTIKKAGDATISAIEQIAKMIQKSKVGPKKQLLLKGKPLTVQDIKLALEHFLLDRGAESAEDAIAAVGKKGFDWHYLGESKDVLKAGVPIILDVFPRLKQERYVADVTRTVVKGQPHKKVREMFEAVIAASDAVVDALTDDAPIDEVNMACYQTLKSHGFDSTRLNPEAVDGMTHGLGHGIGLEVHENPSFYDRERGFVAGHVVAIEPGVYLKAHGGVRLENDYAVTTRKPKRLTIGLDDIMCL